MTDDRHHLAHAPLIQPFREVVPSIDPTAFIAPGAVIIGDVRIGAGASIWYGCVLRGDDHWIEIGAGSNIQDGTIIHVTLQEAPTKVGKNVTVGHGVRLHGCTLEDNCLVGIGAIVLDGATVQSGAFVAAGALVAPGKTIPTGELWGGSPARKLRDLRDSDREYMTFDAAHYQRIAQEYRRVVK